MDQPLRALGESRDHVKTYFRSSSAEKVKRVVGRNVDEINKKYQRCYQTSAGSVGEFTRHRSSLSCKIGNGHPNGSFVMTSSYRSPIKPRTKLVSLTSELTEVSVDEREAALSLVSGEIREAGRWSAFELQPDVRWFRKLVRRQAEIGLYLPFGND